MLLQRVGIVAGGVRVMRSCASVIAFDGLARRKKKRERERASVVQLIERKQEDAGKHRFPAAAALMTQFEGG